MISSFAPSPLQMAAYSGFASFSYHHEGRQPAELFAYMYYASCPQPYFEDLTHHKIRQSQGRLQFRSRELSSVESCTDIHGAWSLCTSSGTGYIAFNWQGSQKNPVTLELLKTHEADGHWVGLHPHYNHRVELKCVATKDCRLALPMSLQPKTLAMSITSTTPPVSSGYLRLRVCDVLEVLYVGDSSKDEDEEGWIYARSAQDNTQNGWVEIEHVRCPVDAYLHGNFMF